MLLSIVFSKYFRKWRVIIRATTGIAVMAFSATCAVPNLAATPRRPSIISRISKASIISKVTSRISRFSRNTVLSMSYRNTVFSRKFGSQFTLGGGADSRISRLTKRGESLVPPFSESEVSDSISGTTLPRPKSKAGSIQIMCDPVKSRINSSTGNGLTGHGTSVTSIESDTHSIIEDLPNIRIPILLGHEEQGGQGSESSSEPSSSHCCEPETSAFRKILNSSWKFKTILFLTGMMNLAAAILCLNYIVNRLMPNLSIFAEKTAVQLSMLPGLLLSILVGRKFGSRVCLLLMLVIFIVSDFSRIAISSDFLEVLASGSIDEKTKTSLELVTLSLGYMATIWFWSSIFVYCNEIFPKSVKATAVSIQDMLGIIGMILTPLLQKDTKVNVKNQNIGDGNNADLISIKLWENLSQFNNIYLAVFLMGVVYFLPDTRKIQSMFIGMAEAEEFYDDNLKFQRASKKDKKIMDMT